MPPSRIRVLGWSEKVPGGMLAPWDCRVGQVPPGRLRRLGPGARRPSCRDGARCGIDTTPVLRRRASAGEPPVSPDTAHRSGGSKPELKGRESFLGSSYGLRTATVAPTVKKSLPAPYHPPVKKTTPGPLSSPAPYHPAAPYHPLSSQTIKIGLGMSFRIGRSGRFVKPRLSQRPAFARAR